MSSIIDINPKLSEIPEKLAKISDLKPRKLYDCNSIPAPLSNVPRYCASSTAVWKQIADYVRAIINKTTSLPKSVINTYVQDSLSLAMHAQHSLARLTHTVTTWSSSSGFIRKQKRCWQIL